MMPNASRLSGVARLKDQKKIEWIAMKNDNPYEIRKKHENQWKLPVQSGGC